MPGSLDTTNTMLAIIAAVSVLQGLVLIGVGIFGWKMYRSATSLMREIDEKRVKPLAAKVDGILDQVHHLTARVNQRAQKVDAALDDTLDRVTDAASDVKSGVTGTIFRVVSAVTGARAALADALTSSEGGRNGQARPAAPPPYAPYPPQTRNVEGGM